MTDSMQTRFHLHLASIDSTQMWAKQHLHELPQEGVSLISAETQTAGRGRFPSRKWASPKGMGVYATFCFFLSPTEELLSRLGTLGLVLALSAALFLEKNGIFPKIKWPNDLLVEQKKIAGVLVETTPVGEKWAALAGLGLNLNGEEATFQELQRPATSLFLETGRPKKPLDALQEIQFFFLHHLALFLQEGFSPFLPSIQERLFHQKGDLISLQLPSQKIVGEMVSILPSGALELLVDGKLLSFYSGEMA